MAQWSTSSIEDMKTLLVPRNQANFGFLGFRFIGQFFCTLNLHLEFDSQLILHLQDTSHSLCGQWIKIVLKCSPCIYIHDWASIMLLTDLKYNVIILTSSHAGIPESFWYTSYGVKQCLTCHRAQKIYIASPQWHMHVNLCPLPIIPPPPKKKKKKKKKKKIRLSASISLEIVN